MVKENNKLERAYRLTDLAVRKANKELKELSNQKKEHYRKRKKAESKFI